MGLGHIQTMEASCSIGYRGIKSERIHHWAEGLPSFYSFTSAEIGGMKMLRPYCCKEMKAGFVQAASNSIFSEKKHLVRMQPANDQEVLLAEQTLYPAAIAAYYCTVCHRVIMNGEERL